MNLLFNISSLYFKHVMLISTFLFKIPFHCKINHIEKVEVCQCWDRYNQSRAAINSKLSGFPTRSDTSRPVHSRKLRILEEGVYYLCIENKDADQGRFYSPHMHVVSLLVRRHSQTVTIEKLSRCIRKQINCICGNR